MPEQAVDVNRIEFVEPHGSISDREAVLQALGMASMCWESVEKAGVFDSVRAAAIGNALCDRLGITRANTPPARREQRQRPRGGDLSGYAPDSYTCPCGAMTITGEGVSIVSATCPMCPWYMRLDEWGHRHFSWWHRTPLCWFVETRANTPQPEGSSDG